MFTRSRRPEYLPISCIAVAAAFISQALWSSSMTSWRSRAASTQAAGVEQARNWSISGNMVQVTHSGKGLP
ncbi:Uncharacterised protein [Acinetobacter baumannii]|nr:Uncharacterised protein [Acinetobacter baumannii]